MAVDIVSIVHVSKAIRTRILDETPLKIKRISSLQGLRWRRELRRRLQSTADRAEGRPDPRVKEATSPVDAAAAMPTLSPMPQPTTKNT
jgi:hypothetical protein